MRSVPASIRCSTNLPQLRERLRSEGWVESALDTARTLISSARRQLDPLPDNSATSMLHQIADMVIDRKF